MNFDVSSLSTTDIAIAAAAGIVFAGYLGFILVPAVRSYGRLWERVGAAVLTFYILGTLVGAGLLVGLAVVWSYDRYG